MKNLVKIIGICWFVSLLGCEIVSLDEGKNASQSRVIDISSDESDVFSFVGDDLSEAQLEIRSIAETFTFVKESDRNLKLDFYPQDSLTQYRGTILLYHGGGWKSGSRENMLKLCKFFIKNGFSCVSAGYRKYFTHQTGLEEAMADARLARSWVFEHAEELKIDTTRFFLGGSSAGGFLAADQMTGLGLVLWNPVLKTSGPGSFDNQLLNDTNSLKVDILSRISSGEVSRPSIVFHGNRDFTVPLRGSEEYCTLLLSYGNDCTLNILEGLGHGEVFGDSLLLKETLESSLEFMEERLGVLSNKGPSGS